MSSELLFSIPALIFVGATWMIVGIVMGSAPKKGINTTVIQLLNGCVTLIVSGCVLVFMPRTECPMLVWLGTRGVFFLAGVFNFANIQTMAAAMRRGPNGFVWVIMQSALIVPFIIGVCFFGVKLTGFRITGVFLILVSLFFTAPDTTAIVRQTTAPGAARHCFVFCCAE